MMKVFFKNALLGIAIGCTVFTVTGMVFDFIFSGGFSLLNWDFTKMAIGSMIIGMGFSVPTVVYCNEKMANVFKILIHMGVGCTIMLIVAFSVGWIPLESGWEIAALMIGGELLAAFLIWLAFFIYYKKLAQKINTKIKNMHDN